MKAEDGGSKIEDGNQRPRLRPHTEKAVREVVRWMWRDVPEEAVQALLDAVRLEYEVEDFEIYT